MSCWVISSNPTVYDAERSTLENGQVDWVTTNDFAVGDTVFIYEVVPPRGRGGIVYKTEVTNTDLSLDDKLDDRKFWSEQKYPKDISLQTKFSRLKLIGNYNGESLSLKVLKSYDFTAPQGSAHLLDKKPRLLNYIQSHFS